MNTDHLSSDALKKHWLNEVHALDQSAIVAKTDPQGRITYVNTMFCKLSEYSEQELLGQTHSLINSGVHDGAFFADMWQTIGRGRVWRGEICNRAKSGKLYWVDTSIVPILGDQGLVEQYIAIRYDITARKQAESNLAKERAKLIESEKMASIGVLSAGIAHELGNPLGAIRGRLEMLESMLTQPDFQKEFALRSVQKMVASVDHMSKIIRGLKSSSRDGRNDEMQEFDLSQLVGDIIELSLQKCVKHNISLTKSGLDTPVVVKGRETEIGQVVVNLFNNAFDSVKGSIDPWIAVTLLDSPAEISLSIKDSGPGVAAENLSKIFDPFFTTKEVGQGTGLGLSICRSFVESHDGELVYDSSQPHSCFTMTLPKVR